MTALPQFRTDIPASYRSQPVTSRRRYGSSAVSALGGSVASEGTAKNVEWRRSVDLGLDDEGQPVSRTVDVRKTDAYVSVADPETGIFGVGDGLPAAVADFRRALLEFRVTLQQDTNLSPSLRHLLAQLLTLPVTDQA